ncbi:MAG: hypothetical protein CR997_01275 [Acidobacteria bacterium]|nr:MAG: hypothetical protein CR997_01275 [Acidobacteriota bacterium]
MEFWHYWIMLSLLLFILEVFTPGGFVLASLGIGALSGAGFAFMGFGLNVQLVCFAIASMIVFFAVRPIYKAYIHKYDNNLPTGIGALVGKDARVIEAIGVPDQSDAGRVKIGGETWRAMSADGSSHQLEDRVEVAKVDGATVWVNKKNKE